MTNRVLAAPPKGPSDRGGGSMRPSDHAGRSMRPTAALGIQEPVLGRMKSVERSLATRRAMRNRVLTAPPRGPRPCETFHATDSRAWNPRAGAGSHEECGAVARHAAGDEESRTYGAAKTAARPCGTFDATERPCRTFDATDRRARSAGAR